MTAGNMSDGEGHGQHRETKGQRHTHKADAQVGKGGVEHRGSATAEHQPESTEEFSRSSLTECHDNLTIRVMGLLGMCSFTGRENGRMVSRSPGQTHEYGRKKSRKLGLGLF